MKRVFFYLFIIFVFSACTKEKNEPSRNLYHEFFPLKEKNVTIYNVDSTFYNDFTGGTATNFKFELKDSVTSSFINLTGDTVYRIERYKKPESENKWTYQKNFSRSLSTRTAEETVNNQTFIKLIFPTERNANWDGNSKNNLEKQIYTVTDFSVPQVVNGQNFEKTVSVTQIEEENLLTKDFSVEVYAANIGLIKKEVTAIEYDFGTDKILKGYSFTMQIKSFTSF